MVYGAPLCDPVAVRSGFAVVVYGAPLCDPVAVRSGFAVVVCGARLLTIQPIVRLRSEQVAEIRERNGGYTPVISPNIQPTVF